MADARVDYGDGGLRVADGRRLDRFIVTFKPDTVARDRVYPLLTRLTTDSLVVHVPSLLADPLRYRATIEIACGGGVCVLAAGALADCGRRRTVHVSAGAQYLYIGPRADIADLGYALFLGTGSAVLDDQVRSALRSSLDDYSRGLALPLAAKPMVVVAQTVKRSPSGFSWRGDTTNQFMFLRFEGALGARRPAPAPNDRDVARCARGESVTLSRGAGARALNVACGRPLPSPLEFRIEPAAP